jgi:hypothetical protein
MKTTSKNKKQKQELGVESAVVVKDTAAESKAPADIHQNIMNTLTGQEPKPRTDTRLPIDHEQRTANRTLPTSKVLAMLQQTAPAVYQVAEVVGKWIWVNFKTTPEAEIRQQLAQLGFHWNRERQVWQHPCGAFRLRSTSGDPHEKYTSYTPARVQQS